MPRSQLVHYLRNHLIWNSSSQKCQPVNLTRLYIKVNWEACRISLVFSRWTGTKTRINSKSTLPLRLTMENTDNSKTFLSLWCQVQSLSITPKATKALTIVNRHPYSICQISVVGPIGVTVSLNLSWEQLRTLRPGKHSSFSIKPLHFLILCLSLLRKMSIMKRK